MIRISRLELIWVGGVWVVGWLVGGWVVGWWVGGVNQD